MYKISVKCDTLASLHVTVSQLIDVMYNGSDEICLVRMTEMITRNISELWILLCKANYKV